MKVAEVLQAVSAFSGIAVALIGLLLWRIKLAGQQALRRVDVSAEWQSQMLSRIALVEADLKIERHRNDELESEAFKWRSQAAELEWELNRTRAERRSQIEAIDELRDINKGLKIQNAALADELRSLYRQIKGGHQTLTIPPLSVPLDKKEK